MQIELPYPHKILWPNGRTRNTGWRNAEFQKHKLWAGNAVLAELRRDYPDIRGRLRLAVTVYPKTKNRIDGDNAAAAMKAYADGIALALRVDDNRFDYAPIQFAEPVKHGRVVICLE